MVDILPKLQIINVEIHKIHRWFWCVVRLYVFVVGLRVPEYWRDPPPPRIYRAQQTCRCLWAVQICFTYVLTWHPMWSPVKCNSTRGRVFFPIFNTVNMFCKENIFFFNYRKLYLHVLHSGSYFFDDKMRIPINYGKLCICSVNLCNSSYNSNARVL